MIDRILIVVLILFMALGATFYEQYAKGRGEVGPIARLLDFAKFGKFSDTYQSRTSHKISHFNSQNSLGLLSEKYQRLEEQRLQLVLNRRALLDQSITVNNQIVQEALVYQHAIEQDRDTFLSRFPELEPLGNSIITTYAISDPAQREQEYQQIKNQLTAILEEFTVQAPEYTQRLHNILDEIEAITNEEQDALAACDDPARCIKEKLDELKDELKAASGDILTSAKDDITTIEDMTNKLREQYQILGQNMEVSDQEIEQNDALVAGQLKRLAENLVAVTEEDLRGVMDTYKEIQEEQKDLLENLALHQERVREAQAETDRRTKQIIARLNHVPRINFEKLTKVYDNVRVERKELFVKFATNEFKVRKVVEERWTDNSNFFDQLVKNAPIDVNKLVEGRKDAERAARSRLNLLSGANSDLNGFERNNDLKTGRGAAPLRSKDNLGSRKQEEADEQFRRLKDKARDQGF